MDIARTATLHVVIGEVGVEGKFYEADGVLGVRLSRGKEGGEMHRRGTRLYLVKWKGLPGRARRGGSQLHA